MHVVINAGCRSFQLRSEYLYALSFAFGSSHCFHIESLQPPLKADIDNLSLKTKLLQLGKVKVFGER